MRRSANILLLTALALLTTLALSPDAARAQVRFGLGYGAGRWYSPAGYGVGGYGMGGYGMGYGYASTPAQGYMQGMSSVIRAEGQANEMNSKAAINYEQARSSYIDNEKKWNDVYHEVKKAAQERSAEQAAKDRAARDHYLATQQSGMPPRLTASQLDWTTGHIIWPEVLKAPTFTEDRKKIEELILLRTFTSMTGDLSAQLHDAARAMQSDLKTVIREVPANEYIDARKFLDSLAFEGRYPIGS